MDHNYETIWSTYTSSWRATTRAERMKFFAEALSNSCVYTDPLTKREGYEGLSEYMDEFQRQIPGGHFKTKWFLAYRGQSIALWDMLAGDGTKMGEGASYGTYDASGKLTSMTGFFEKPQ